MEGRKRRFVIGIFGGFGNNLHQIALGKFLEFSGFSVKYDLSLIPSNSMILSIPKINEYLISRESRVTRFLPSPWGRFRKLAIVIRKNLGPNNIVISTNSFDTVDISTPSGAWLYGYWQRLEYSHFFLPELKMIFSSTSINEDSLMIHVRRGDFRGTPSFLENNYYEFALQTSLQEICDQIENVYVISDDAELDLSDFDFPSGIKMKAKQSSMQDFQSLVNAKYLIISRSTFSWWAGMIGNGRVFYPSPWDSESKHDSQIPDEWTPIDWN